MNIVKSKDIQKGYASSKQPLAKNWEVSLLWQSKKPRENVRLSFTALNRTPRDVKATYPPITLVEGTMEYYILEGEFRCNNRKFKKGDYTIFMAGDTMKWSSSGGEMLVMLKGKLKK